MLKVYETEENKFLLEALRVIETMIELGFYRTEQELIEVTSPLIHILNGTSDYYSPEESQQHEDPIAREGKERPLQKEGDSAKKRYLDSPSNLLVMNIKNKIIDICSLLMKFQANMRLTIFLIRFA